MEKKRSIGVTIFGILFLFLGFLLVLGFLFILVNLPTKVNVPKTALTLNHIQIIFLGIVAAYPVLLGFGILGLKEWARKSGIIINGILCFCFLSDIAKHPFSKEPSYLMTIFVLVVFIIFFTRPKVKEQFKNC